MNDTAAVLQAISDNDLPIVERLLIAGPRLVRASDEYLKTPAERRREVVTITGYSGDSSIKLHKKHDTRSRSRGAFPQS